MTTLSDAEQAAEEARVGVLEFALASLRGDSNPPVEEYAAKLVDRLIAAVRHHDAEIARAEQLDELDGFVIRPAFRDPWEEGRDLAADAIAEYTTPADLYPEVEVRFASGPTIRVARFDVTTDAATGLVVVEGEVASRTGQPPSGDAVRIAYLGIPGRGALMDVTASVELFTRLTVLNIRIRTTTRPKVTP